MLVASPIGVDPCHGPIDVNWIDDRLVPTQEIVCYIVMKVPNDILGLSFGPVGGISVESTTTLSEAFSRFVLVDSFP